MGETNLSDAKKALLQKWLSGGITDTTVTIPKLSPGSPLSLSYPQQWQLFIEILQPGTAVNNLSVLLDIRGKLDFAALQKSANDIISRHESLSTCFSFSGGFPQATIANDIQISIPVVDLRNSVDRDRQTNAKQLAEQDILLAFDLMQAPLIRLKLFHYGEDHNFLLVTIHHLIADGWSLGVFLNELTILYHNITTGGDRPLPGLAVQYKDFAAWQTDANRLTSLQASLNYWKQQLAGDLPVLELPADHPRPTKQSFVGRTYRFKLTNSLTRSLERFCQQEDVSLFMTLMTAFNVVLHRYSGQEDILVGTPVANRSLQEIENLIGVFINTIVIRTIIQGDPTFRELLQQVKIKSLEAYTNQDLPFERLVEELKPKRDLSRSPVFQFVFNLQNSPLPGLNIDGLSIAPLEIDRGVSQFDLTLMMTRSEGHYNCTVEFDSCLFSRATIRRIFDSFQSILRDAVTDGDKPISKIKIIDENYFHRVVDELNETQMNFPRQKSFNQLFEEQVQKRPNACAVVHQDRKLTYHELNQRANRLARHLQFLGVAPGVRVGVLLEKTLETTEALLAIMKTGAIYVPIGTSLPTERIKFILEDAGLQLLLTNIESGPFSDLGIKTFYQRGNKHLTIADDSDLQINIRPNDLAYIIYTSGSTGLPKGVMIQHSALMNFIYSMQIEPAMSAEEVLLSVTSISFDIAALELFLPLSVGATVVIAGKEIMANPLSIAEAIETYSIDMMQATPAVWQLLIDSGWRGKQNLKALCGGDALTRKLADQILERVGCLWNMYGPTETTIWSAVNQVKKDNSPISIGRPIANTQLYILDRYMQPAPIGVAGELLIGGEGLALGYLNRSGLTSEKFISLSVLPGRATRLYKTGDHARYLPDYSIEIIGRTDHQIKLHGHRIELGEISSVLLQHSLIRDAVAMMKEDNLGRKRVLAYFVSKNNQEVDKGELQEHLRKKLPSYMMPEIYIQLQDLPLNPNGKLDRGALPTPEDIFQRSKYVAPTTEVEHILTDIWQNVLQVDRVGVNDNFFDLGGASIQTLQVVASASLVGLRLSPEAIFEYQTIAELSSRVERDKLF